MRRTVSSMHSFVSVSHSKSMMFICSLLSLRHGDEESIGVGKCWLPGELSPAGITGANLPTK
jgi:hypothetical protein